MYGKQELAKLGQEASALFLKHGMTLNDAVVKVASARPDLSKEHVQRIIENANLITFEDMFKGASSKHITFDLAEPDVIHDQLDGSTNIVDPIYSVEPTRAKTASYFDMIEEEPAVAPVPKSVRWKREYYATKTAAARLEESAIKMDAVAEAETHKFIDMCKRASLENGIKPVLQLAGYASKDKEIFQKIASVTISAIGDTVKQGEYSDVRPNVDHPLYKQYEAVETLIKEANRFKSGVINAVRMHESVKSEEFLNEH